MPLPFPRLLGGALLALTVSAPAQELVRVVPAAFAPGALVRLEGEGLEGAREATFLAAAGGDLQRLGSPLLRGPQGEWLVVAPAFGDVGPGLDGPWGWLAIDGAAPRPVYLFEGSGGRIRSAGSGSQLADGRRLSISFDLAGGPPVPGNAGFTLELHGAPSGVAAFAAVGPPCAQPWPRVRDATLVADPATLLLLGPVAVDDGGCARVALPVPMLSGVELAVQWVACGPGRGEPLYSDVLVVLA